MSHEPFEREKLEKELAERRMIRMVRAFMQKSQEYRRPHLDLARKSRELYETWQGHTKSMIQRANLKLPFGYTIIETQIPQITGIFFGDGSPIKFKGRGPEDAEWENAMTDFHNFQLKEMNFQSNAIAFIKSMLLDGTAFAKVPFKFVEKEIVRRRAEIDPVTGQPIPIKEKVLTEIFSGPAFELIPIQDIFLDWSVRKAGDIQSMRAIVHRTYRTLTELNNAGIYKNLDKVKLSVHVKGNNAWKAPFFDEGESAQFDRFQDNVPGIKDPGQIEVWEYWGLWDPKGDGNFEEYIITIANGDVVIRAEPNFYDLKFKPFVACPNIIRENEFYGIPELIPLRSLIKEANTLRNARLDSINLSVNPMWLVDRASGINIKSLYSRPNGIITTNDINGIKPLQIPDPSVGSFSEVQNLQQDIQNASGLLAGPTIDTVTGRALARSATGVAFLQNFANSRIAMKARLLSDHFFKKVAQIMLMTNQQFVTEDQWVRVLDPQSPNPFVQLPTDAFFRKYDFEIESDFENGGLQGELQKMQIVAQTIAAFEQSQPGTIKADVVLDALLRPLLGRQIPRFVRNEEERLQLQQQRLAAQQAVNAAQGQAAPQPNAQVQGASLSQLQALGLGGEKS